MSYLKKILIIFYIFTFNLGFSQNTKIDNKFNIIVSIPVYKYFVEKIVQNELKVICLLPENTNPHNFEPTTKQIKLAFSTNIFFKIGEPFERYFEKALEKKNIKIIDLKKDITLLEISDTCKCKTFSAKDFCFIDSIDKHIWLSPKLAKIQIKTIYDALVEVYPEKKEIFEKNYSLFLEELIQLDNFIITQLKKNINKTFLISHGAYNYFCKDYNLKQIPIELEGRDLSIKKINNLLKQAKKDNIKKIIIQNQHNNRAALYLAKKLNLGVKLIDPYSEEYEKNLKEFVYYLVHE